MIFILRIGKCDDCQWFKLPSVGVWGDDFCAKCNRRGDKFIDKFMDTCDFLCVTQCPEVVWCA